MTRNPFITRGMIKSKKGFWGRALEIRTLYSLLLDSEEEPQSAVIVGLRRMGKSSLMHRISKKYDAPEMYEHQLEQMICIMISLQSMSTATKEDFFTAILAELQDQDEQLSDLLSNSPVSQNEGPESRFAQILRVMNKGDYSLVLLIDEFEAAAENPNFDKPFFDLLRSFAQRWRVAFVVATQTNLDELWDKSLISSPFSSPFFNFFQTLSLRGFDEEEIGEYLGSTSLDAGFQFEDKDIELIKEIGGNHPFFLNVAAYHLFQTNSQKEKFLGKSYEDFRIQISQDPTITGNFKYYWQCLSEPQKITLLSVANGEIGDNSEELSPELRVDLDWLNRRGLVRLDKNTVYAPFSEAFRQFVLGNQQINYNRNNNYEIQKIISQNESISLEFKMALHWDFYQDKKNGNLTDGVVKTIAAFLNTDGGTLLIGVDNSNKVLGLEKDYKYLKKKNGRDAFELSLTQLISSKIGKNFCNYVRPVFHTVEEHEVCQVIVTPSEEPVYVGKDTAFFVRTRNSTQELNTREAHEYIKKHWSDVGAK